MFKLSFNYFTRNYGKTFVLMSSVIIAIVLFLFTSITRDSIYDSQIEEARSMYGSYDIEMLGLTKNNINVLSSDKEINNLFYTEVCDGDLIDRSTGLKTSIYVFNKPYVIDCLKYSMIGRVPQNDNEIILEDKFINQLGIKDPIGKYVNLLHSVNYNKNDENHIKSKDKKFKIVGILKKTGKYYESLTDSIGGIKYRAFIFDEDSLQTRFFDKKYDGCAFLKGKNAEKYSQHLQNKLNLGWENIHENSEVSSIKLLKQSSELNVENIRNTILIVLISIIVIYNIFDIILSDMRRELATFRSLGMTKKQLMEMLFIYASFFVVIGALIGVFLSILISYSYISFMYDNPVLTISYTNIGISIFIAVFAVYLSNIVLVYKLLKNKVIELMKYENIKNQKKWKFKINMIENNIIVKLALSNIWADRTKTIISILTMTAVGLVFILNFASADVVKKSMYAGRSGGIWSMSYGNIDKKIDGSIKGTDPLYFNISTDIVEKVKASSYVKCVEYCSMTMDAFLLDYEKKVSEQYKEEVGINSIEYPIMIRAYNKNMLKKRNRFIDKGSNIYELSGNKKPRVLIVNNLYSKKISSVDRKILNKVSVGDTLKIKMPVDNKGTKEYRVLDVEVSGIMNTEYAGGQDGNVGLNGAQVIINEMDYRRITNIYNNNSLFITTNNNEIMNLERDLKKIISENEALSIGGKGEEIKYLGLQLKIDEKLRIMYSLTAILIVFINTIFIIKSNLIIRKKEIHDLLCIGMSRVQLRENIYIEGIFYGVLSSIISSIVASSVYMYKISNVNKVLKEAKFTKMIENGVPVRHVVQIFVLFTAVSVVSTYIASKSTINKRV